MGTLFFRQPRLVMLALLVILSAGVFALVSIGRQEDPTITNIFATITTVFPGADPIQCWHSGGINTALIITLNPFNVIQTKSQQCYGFNHGPMSMTASNNSKRWSAIMALVIKVPALVGIDAQPGCCQSAEDCRGGAANKTSDGSFWQTQ